MGGNYLAVRGSLRNIVDRFQGSGGRSVEVLGGEEYDNGMMERIIHDKATLIIYENNLLFFRRSENCGLFV